MAQPLPYERDYDFQNFQSGHPSTPLPGDKVNAELDQIAATLDEVLARIALLQDDDTALKRGAVGYDQLAVGVSLGFNPPAMWTTATAYIARDTVFKAGSFYQCLVSHTSGTFATDLAAGKWELLVDFASTDAEVARLTAAGQVITGGARVTSLSLGTITSGTVEPDPGDRPLQHYANNGAHELAPGSNTGSYILDITNGSFAGEITTSGFTRVVGDSFTTTNGHKFRCSVSVGDAGSLLVVTALQ